MINFETAKKLKDAGFLMAQFVEKPTEPYDVQGSMEIDGVWYMLPSLSELIEACGDRFDLLERVEDDEMSGKAPRDEVNNRIKGGWEASSLDDIRGYKWEYGPTPEEAVANLWIALNTKTI